MLNVCLMSHINRSIFERVAFKCIYVDVFQTCPSSSVRDYLSRAELLSEKNKHIPLAEIMFVIGFLVIYFIEEVVDYASLKRPMAKDGVDKPANKDVETSVQPNENYVQR